MLWVRGLSPKAEPQAQGSMGTEHTLWSPGSTTVLGPATHFSSFQLLICEMGTYSNYFLDSL